MNIRRLHAFRLFYTVAREGSFSRAAKALCMSQPPLSAQVAALEEELGAPLFQRTPRGVRLTPQGEGIMPLCAKLFAQADEFEAAVQGVMEGSAGSVKIGAIRWITQSLLPKVVWKIRTDYPGIKIEILDLPSIAMPPMLLNNEVDLCFGYISRASRDDLDTIVAKKFDLVVAMPSWHPLAKFQRISLETLKTEPYVITDRDVSTEYHDAMVSLCAAHDVALNIVIRAQSVASQLFYINAGAGIALLPRSSLSTLPPNVVTRELKEKLQISLMCITRKTGNSPVVERFKTYLRQTGLK